MYGPILRDSFVTLGVALKALVATIPFWGLGPILWLLVLTLGPWLELGFFGIFAGSFWISGLLDLCVCGCVLRSFNLVNEWFSGTR